MTTLSVRRCAARSGHLPFFWLFCFAFFTLSPSLLPVSHASPPTKKLKATDAYALIFGTVWGPDDHPVYGIKVKIHRANNKSKWETYSDHAGEFAQRVPAGKADYLVEADLKGVKTSDGHALHLVEKMPVHIEYDERVDIGLHLSR